MQIKSLMSCFNCESDLSAQLDDNGVVDCPHCGSPNGPGLSNKFEDPYYASEQMRRLGNDDWLEFTKKRPAKKVIACAEETLRTIEVITHKPMTEDEMRDFMTLCKTIGQVADALEASFAAGAKYTGREEEMPNESNTQDENVRSRTPPKAQSKTVSRKHSTSRM